MEKNPANAISCVRSAATSPFTWRMTKGSSGLGLRSSLSANATIKTAAPPKVRIVWLDPQPTVGARTRLYTSSSMLPVTNTAPCESKAARSVLTHRSFASSATAPAATRTQIGGFTKNTHRHPGPWAITPPRNTPAAAAIPLIAPPRSQRRVAVLALAEARREFRKCRGSHERRADTLHESGSDEESRGVG